jgi:hypothetical protein
MKGFFTFFLLLTMMNFGASASEGPLVSKNLEGKYELLVSDRDDQFRCSEYLEVSVTEGGVTLSNGLGLIMSFTKSKKKNLTQFSSDKVSFTETQSLSILGYKRYSESLSLNQEGDTAVLSRNTTVIPFGFIDGMNDGDFKCRYKRELPSKIISYNQRHNVSR